MVYQKEALELTYATISSNLNVDLSTVKRTVKLFRETGLVDKQPYPVESATKKLTPVVQSFILNIVLQKPGIYLREIKQEAKEELGLDIDISSICKFLHKSGFTHQRLHLVAIQQDADLRMQFCIDMSIYTSSMMIFVDEMGTDKKDTIRKRGYSIRGRPLVAHKLLVKGEHISAIAAISWTGLLDVKLCNGAVDGDIFYSFLMDNLLPHLNQFDGDSAHSVVVLDNCSIHHPEECVRVVNDSGALVHFLPPYSPDYNPIENIFSKVKTVLKALEIMNDDTDMEELIFTAFATITPEDCRNSIANTGIYHS